MPCDLCRAPSGAAAVTLRPSLTLPRLSQPRGRAPPATSNAPVVREGRCRARKKGDAASAAAFGRVTGEAGGEEPGGETTQVASKIANEEFRGEVAEQRVAGDSANAVSQPWRSGLQQSFSFAVFAVLCALCSYLPALRFRIPLFLF